MSNLSPFQSEIAALLIALRQNAHDPTTFAALRAKILALHFGTVRTEDLAKIQSFQDQIEGHLAINGFNQTSVVWLLDQIKERVELLRSLVLRIESSLQGTSENS